MARLNFSNNLFLGLQELQRMQKFQLENFKKIWQLELYSSGLFRSAYNNSIQNNWLVVPGSNRGGFLSLDEDSYAIDREMQLIYLTSFFSQNFLEVPSDSNWYWVLIKYMESTLEEGIVSIDSSGNLVGVGTKFTEVLRGGSIFPSKIVFNNTIEGNYSEYEVVSVISDASAILVGQFSPEINLNYSVVGTFTPGAVIPGQEKFPFKYDECQYNLMQEVIKDTPPHDTEAGMQFAIARVSYNGATLSIQDKRTEFYKTRIDVVLESIIETLPI